MAPGNELTSDVARARRDGVLFGIPLGELGFFQTMLMATATGFAAFFAATFLAIVALMIDLMVTHHTPDFALTYRRFGFPVGITVLAIAWLYLGSLWVRRKVRKA
jgi:heme exporter protein D